MKKNGKNKVLKSFRKWLCMILVAAILSCVPVSGEALKALFTQAYAETVISGKCGYSVTWTLENDGTLTISGSGEMYNYDISSSNEAPWEKWKWSLKTVVIQSGVKSIGDYAFDYYSNLTSVTIPDSVTSIGKSAFYSCSGLTSVTIPDSVTSIGDYAFYSCSGLTSVTISNSLKSIGDYAFRSCTGLTSVTIPDSVTSIGDFAFSSCTGLTSITIPNGVTSTGIYAFEYCSNLTSVTIPNSVTSIGNGAFNHCSSLTSVIIPDSVTSIGHSAFSGCSSLTSVTIPNSVTSIGSSAFSDCSGLKGVTIPNSVTSIGDSAFSSCTSLTSVSIPNSVTSIDDSTFKSCSSLTSISIPDSVTSIGSSAFSGCSSLTSVSIPSSVTSIGNNPFGSCANITSLIVENGNPVYHSKNNCIINTNDKTLISGCKTSEIPSDGSVTSIGNGAFGSCTGLTSVTIPNSVTSIGGGAFSSCKGLTSITIPNSVTSIGGTAFSSCTGLTSIKIPNSVTSIGNSAFIYCKGLTKVTISNSMTSIGYCVFFGCSSLKSVTIPNSVKNIGGSAFDSCSSLTSVTIPNSVKSIGNSAFYGCNALSQVYYTGDAADWEKIQIDSYNSPLKNATITYNYVPQSEETEYVINYNSNGGSGAPEAQTKTERQTLTLSSLKPVKTYTVSFNANGGSVSSASKTVNCAFDSWNTAQNGSGVSYAPGGSYTDDADVTLYAQWSDPTAGTLPTPTRNGFDFSGWYTAASGGTRITSSSVISGDITVYAHWSSTPVDPQPTSFTWGKDNWNFLNSSYTGDFSSGTYRSQINSTYLNVLENSLTNTEYQYIFKEDGWLDGFWGGSCYGMSSTVLLAKQGYLPYANYKNGASTLYQLSKPTSSSDVSSLITYYQMLQVKDVIQQQYRTVPYRSNETNIKQIISLLNENPTVLVGFQKTGWGGHAILAYGYEYGSYTYNGVTYQGCIYICDPNASMAYDARFNIYFNTQTYHWAIPAYYSDNIMSARGAVFNYVGANVNEINQGGYLSGTSNHNALNYIARIDAYAIGETRTVSKVQQNNGNYMTMNTAPGDIIEDYSYVLGNKSEGTIGYNLADGNAAYMITQTDPVEMNLTMDYENSLLGAFSAAGKRVIFDKSGYVEITGESADYRLDMTFDDDYPTDWFAVKVQGGGADYASLQKTEDGYILTADVLKNVTVSANNREQTATVTFSAEYPSVCIYEVNETTIGIKIDTDYNGTYETVLTTGSESNMIPGDVDNDGKVTASDARLALRQAVNLEKYAEGSAEFLACDVDHDGKVTANDARSILRAAVGLEELK